VYLYLMALRLRVGRLENRLVAEALSPRLGQPAEALLEGARPAEPSSQQEAEEVPARG
jgi:hypothetical protein